jgi:subtilisin-like proprotein convertase family protein/C1A family cysteine protease
MMKSLRLAPWSAPVGLALIVVASACSSGGGSPAPGSALPAGEEEAPLGNPDELLAGAPDNSTLPEEGKADAVYPDTFTDLIKLQSPVRNQRSRGVCSIFSTAALMEHLYIAEGTLKEPDFSEQFLQWSVKFEVGDFTNTEGSNASSNIDAINQYGIVDENAWPYEPTKWTSANDPACTGGETQPIKCYTNGDPPKSALEAPRYKLPSGRYVNSSDRSIKAFMYGKRQAVVAGGKFFYQAWNHGASALPTNGAYSSAGYVLYPNDKDKEESLKKPAGHSFLLVGWDDKLEVQQMDAEGKPVVDAQGNPVKEKGFFLFKNSWGTGRFGVTNPHGAGYGWISYRYVKEYGSVYGSDLPTIKKVPEVCNDKKDNDLDGKIDCDDTDCANDAACKDPTGTGTYSNTTATPIPDNTPAGIQSVIDVPDAGAIASLSVTVDITHPYRGDLTVKLVKEGGPEVMLSDREGSSEDDLKRTFAPVEFNGIDAKGKWTLVVIDGAKQDVGTLNGWSLQITRCPGGTCNSSASHFENAQPQSIPDNNAVGVFSNIEIADSAPIKGLTIGVDITHPAKGDLTIKLQKLMDPSDVVLLKADASTGPFSPRTFTVPDFNGKDMKGTWRLTVIDEAANDTGTLNKWTIDVQK